MRIKEIYRGNTPPRDTDSVWIRGKEILLFTNEGWVNVNESTVVDTELDPESNHPIANSAVAASLSNAEENLSETSENLIKNKAVYNQYMTTDDINEILVIIDPSYNREIFKKKYFTLEFITSGKFYVEGTSFYMSKNDEDWQRKGAYNYQNVSAGDIIKIKASGDIKNVKLRVETAQFNAYGNILSLFYGDDFLNYDSLPVSQTSEYRACNEMFKNSEIVSAENLILPETVQDYCYSSMFKGCTKLEKGPDLLATTLKQYCYSSMFSGCTSLVHIPKIGVIETVANRCCVSMFESCTSLVDTPTLAAAILSSSCYENMFRGCTSLETAPNLPATTLATSCYAYMFHGCTSLINIPKILPAETLESYCYQNMFSGCSSITESPVLPAASITKSSCYERMFSGCSSLSKIKCLGDPISQYNTSMSNWVNGVSATGVLIKNPAVSSWTYGNSGVPTGWTIEDNA